MKLCFVISLMLCYCADSSPVEPDTLQFDSLDSDLDDMSYDIEEEDIDDFSRLLDDIDAKNAAKDNSDIRTSGFRKKSTVNNGSKSNHKLQDLKKFYKSAGLQDRGAYRDGDVFAVAEAAAAHAVGIKGNEDRTYRKGIKTRGFHRVHHKDEYKKDKVFYEDDETKGILKKIGAKGLGLRIGAGAGFNKGHFHHDHHKGIQGRQGYSDKGFLKKQYKGYSDSRGFDGSFGDES